jgi:hypothetical protein
MENSMKESVCFWSVGDGECSYMLQALVDSFHRVGMKEDFHVFSDRMIPGATTHLVEAFDKRGFFFKFVFLQSVMAQLDYEYFIYLDADTLFLRKPAKLLEGVRRSPIHFFLESACTDAIKEKEWWNCPLGKYVQLMRDCGVSSPCIYTLNSGMFILKKEIIGLACSLAHDFWIYTQAAGYFFPDEPLWGYAMHMLCDRPESHLLKDNFDLWCSDWHGEWADRIPDGESWTFYDYFTKEPHEVNPAIIHALRSKRALITYGMGQ